MSQGNLFEVLSNDMYDTEMSLIELFYGIAGNDTYDNLLYHYTNGVGLRGIVESNSLWATNLAFMNDAQELRYGLSVFREQAQAKIAVYQDNEVHVRILNTFIKLLEDMDISTSYATCFSQRGDQLSQWRGYTPNTVGYSLGFAGMLDQCAVPDDRWFSFPVIYSEQDQQRFVWNLITSFMDCLGGGRDLSLSESDESYFCRRFAREAAYWVVGLKHDGFSEEQETRLVPMDVDQSWVKVRKKTVSLCLM